MSLSLSQLRTNSINTVPSFMYCRTKWYLVSTCFVLSLLFWFSAKNIALMLSTCTRIGNWTSTRRCFNSCNMNNTSFTTSLQATYSASVVDSVTLFCPRERQHTGTLIKYTTYPVTLIRVSLSPAKSASEYAFNYCRCLLASTSTRLFTYPMHTLSLCIILSYALPSLCPLPLTILVSH